MVIVPDSDIILIKSPLKLDNYNQITFNNATSQYNYFIGLPHLEYDGCTYVRKDEVIRYATGDNLRFEDLLGYNYCMYKNDSYKDKWFYAFITDIKYINDGMSEITIETDVFQTWQFDLIYMNSFIEREHVSNDTIGLHTIPEGLETGEYVINDSNLITHLFDRDSCYVCAAVTWLPSNTPSYNDERYYGNIFSGTWLLVFSGFSSAGKFIRAYDSFGRGDAITSLYLVPSSLIVNPEWHTYSTDTITGIKFAFIPNSISSSTILDNINYTTPSSLNGYTPKNNKLFVWPYNYLSITNNSGSQVSFKYEEFINNTPSFKLEALPTCGVPSMLIPKNYKLKSEVTGTDAFYSYGLQGGKFPVCSWQTDTYTNWLTQNGINIGPFKLDAVQTNILSSLGNIGQFNKGGAIGSIFNSIREGIQHSYESPTLNGQTTVGDLNFADNGLVFHYFKMSIRYEYAKVIDNFFSMYGYKVNELKTPNIHKRLNWDYMKTIDINIEGNVPEKDLDKIRSLFNDGCTFWHNTSTFLDYSQTNSIL